MLRRARNPYLSLLLVVAGSAIALATGAVVVPGSTAPATQLPPAPPESSPSSVLAAPAPTSPPATMPPPTPPTTTPPTTTTAPPVERVAAQPTPSAPLVPTRVRIAKIGVDASMTDLHKQADNTLEVPEDIRLTGWYTGRSVPGEPGPSVVVGHVDSAAEGPGVFYRLKELMPGDLIEIERSDGSIAKFRVTDSELVLKSQFPTEKVYGSVEGSKLRVITCGGTFNASTHHYEGNVIVYADHVETSGRVTPRSDGWSS
jgi:sortase (surface protein transpeptidase)